jgi:hypothetical protein
MNWKNEWKWLILLLLSFLGAFFLPVGTKRFDNALMESLYLVRWYAREHVILCLVPAFFIAGAIAVFVSQASVMKYLGVRANKVLAYGVASVSGTILAVCSCTVLPLFAGIYRMGAGLGPATTFLYSGPAINVLAIVLTARVLGLEIGVARAVGAISFSIMLGLLMHVIYRREEVERANSQAGPAEEHLPRNLAQNIVYFAAMVGILIFTNWGKPAEPAGVWQAIYSGKWLITGAFAAALGIVLVRWFGMAWWKTAAVAGPTAVLAVVLPERPLIAFVAATVGVSIITSTSDGEVGEWFSSTWGFAKQILPLLFFGVLAAGLFLGRPDHEGLIPSQWIARAVGGNSLGANFFASVAGAFMYFATLTEVPILQGLMGAGMGKGPALAMLLAGPAVSLPSMLVLRGILGTQKTVVFGVLVVVMATLSGVIFGALFEVRP